MCIFFMLYGKHKIPSWLNWLIDDNKMGLNFLNYMLLIAKCFQAKFLDSRNLYFLMYNVGCKCTYSTLLLGGLNEAMSVIRHLKVPLQIPTLGSPFSHSPVISPVQVQQLEGNQLHIGTPWQHLTLWLHQVLSRSALGLSSWCWRGGCETLLTAHTCSAQCRGNDLCGHLWQLKNGV